jgi:curved DNA-binding protein CbpA
MSTKEYYEVLVLIQLLEIQTDADQDAIKKAYRKIALKLHPDRAGSTPENIAKFQRIQQVYETLCIHI